MILQLKTGRLDTDYFSRKFGVNIWAEFAPQFKRLGEEGMLEREAEKIELTRRGLLEVDHFLSDFFEPELRSVRYV